MDNCISAIEDLLCEEGLLCGLVYDNKKKNPSEFYKLVYSYAELQSVKIHENAIGFGELMDHNKYFIKQNLELLSERPFDAITNLSLAIFSLPTILVYPLFGTNINSFEVYEDGDVGITTSGYRGVLNSFHETCKVHEFLHCYHYLLSVDEKFKHLNLFDGVSDFFKEKITYHMCGEMGLGKGPDSTDIKYYENNILEKIISVNGRRS